MRAAALCYAEFASQIPVAGSAYTYAYATLGELIAWIIGWDLVLEYAIASCAVAHGWSHYLQAFLALFDVHLPASLATDPLSASAEAHASAWHVGGIPIVFDLPAVVIVALLTVVLVIGIKESAGLNSAIVALKLGIVLFVIAAGYGHIDPANWHPFFHHEKGISGTFQGAAYVFFAYIGFDSISTHAEEARNPERDVPIAILVSLASAPFYIAVAGVLTGGGTPPSTRRRSRTTGHRCHLYPFGPSHHQRLRDGWSSCILRMPRFHADLFAATTRRAIIETILVGISRVVALLPNSQRLVNIGTLFAFVVCASVLIMRYTRPDVPRPFRTPLVPLVPILGMIANLTLMVALGWHNWIRLFVWLGIGLVIYAGYGYHRSRLATHAR
jgi:APA family basic amino acid/polyamine antiporter